MKHVPFVSAVSRRAGFTLAEVMIAMGIVASVMVGLLGMTTMSVRSIRQSSNLAMEGRIAQEVISNIQMADWEDMEAAFQDKTFYFDNEGFGMAKAGDLPDAAREKPSFEARVRLAEDAVTIGRTEFRKSSVRKVAVVVEFTPGGVRNTAVTAANRGGAPGRFTFYVANQNKL